MRKPKITVVGASNFDLISYLTRLPKEGETVKGLRFHMGCGGKGANQAVMAAKMGAAVTIVTKVGEDLFGEKTCRNFIEHGINIEYFYFTKKTFTGVAPITVDQEGRNAIIIIPGANDLLTEAEVEKARPAIAASDLLICQSEIPPECTLKALRIAREAGVKTILNPSPAVKLEREFYELSDIICPNEGEAQTLTGIAVADAKSAETAGRKLIKKGAGSAVITVGEHGCHLIEKDRPAIHVPTIQVQARDTSGAGDCFLGSFAFFHASGLSLNEAIKRANEVAAMSVQGAGTQSSYPEAEDLPPSLFEGIN